MDSGEKYSEWRAVDSARKHIEHVLNTPIYNDGKNPVAIMTSHISSIEYVKDGRDSEWQ